KGKDKAELPLLPSEVEYGSFFAEFVLWNRPSHSISCRRRLCMNWNSHERVRGQLLSGFDLRYLLIEGFKPLKRKLLSLRLKPCGLIVGFRRVTPTIFQFLDNRSQIMLAAGANPIFAHTSLVVWELNQKHRMKGSFQDHPLWTAVAGRGSIFSW
ncbi:LOW QUALITY PROTEIN: uncharacterized protein LOC127744639, partial [Arachis duranensis]|uniref:LOW QUALITY PROTEIN: uncharacterized protein LOC127744639 n=1 Tax=Arachis duranensis TaxID=130453 RepID=A0A9C6WNV7_ARADU